MDEEDFLEIENRLREQCRRIGVPELTEDRFYEFGDGVEEPARLLPPRARVIAQIEALERFLSLYDGGVYNSAMEKIEGLLRQSPERSGHPQSIPDHAVVLLPERSTTGDREFDLRNLPNLQEVRSRLKVLANYLREA
jgi:hypothetical protein